MIINDLKLKKSTSAQSHRPQVIVSCVRACTVVLAFFFASCVAPSNPEARYPARAPSAIVVPQDETASALMPLSAAYKLLKKNHFPDGWGNEQFAAAVTAMIYNPLTGNLSVQIEGGPRGLCLRHLGEEGASEVVTALGALGTNAPYLSAYSNPPC